MNLEKFVTLLATLVGAFWVLLQIITHVREKGHRNVLTALVLMMVGAVPVIWFIWQPPPSASQSSPPPASPAHALAVSPTPHASPSPQPSPSPQKVASPSPSPSPTRGLQASFQVGVTHNLVGGLSAVLLDCVFENTRADPVIVTGYTIDVHVQAHHETTPQDHLFDRVLPTPVEVVPGAPHPQNLAVDGEIGDLLLAYRKSPAAAWVHVTWHAQGPHGQPIDVTSDNNTSPQASSTGPR